MLVHLGLRNILACSRDSMWAVEQWDTWHIECCRQLCEQHVAWPARLQIAGLNLQWVMYSHVISKYHRSPANF